MSTVLVEEVTRADCRDRKFTGIRSDRILQNVELWRSGVLVAEFPQQEMTTNPEAFRKAYAQAFGLREDQVILPG